jgi:DNA-binding response OmpR family regulator
LTIRVVAIEDDTDVAEVIRTTLRRAGMAAEVVSSGAAGSAAASARRPDVVLLDLDLPDIDGLEMIPELAAIAPVIVLTGSRSEDAIVNGLERGADDYITKPFSPRVLVARIEVAARRPRPEETTRIEHGPLVVDVEGRAVTLAGRALDLTRREHDLLVHLALRPGVVVSREDLLGAVWHSSAEWQGPATVTEHVRRLRLKLGDDRWIANVRGVGYRFEGPPS